MGKTEHNTNWGKQSTTLIIKIEHNTNLKLLHWYKHLWNWKTTSS